MKNDVKVAAPEKQSLVTPAPATASSAGKVVDNRPTATTQNRLADMARRSPQLAAQRQLRDHLHRSPRAAAQRAQIAMFYGDAAQSQEAGQEPALQGDSSEGVQMMMAAPAAASAPASPPDAAPPNRTGLPDQLKGGIESLSGMSMDSVRVHYNSAQPAQLNALAYAQGTDIHLAPGQEKHLSHEAWHVVQQAQGRVRPTMQMKQGVPVNDDAALEHEADVMGAKAMQMQSAPAQAGAPLAPAHSPTVQRLTGVEVELHVPFYGPRKGNGAIADYFVKAKTQPTGVKAAEGEKIADFIFGGLDYGKSYGEVAGLFDVSADHTGFQTEHINLYAHLVNQGYMRDHAFETMTNIEYRSKPFEERRDSSQAKVRRVAKKIQAHAQDAGPKATSGSSQALRAPVDGYKTGVPVAELNKLLAGDNVGLGLVTAMSAAINPRIYLQTTTGTLPSEVPGLFAAAAADIKLSDPASARAGLLENAVRTAQEAVTANMGTVLLSGLKPGEVASLTGWLTLVAQYLLSYQLETSSFRFTVDASDNKLKAGASTEKNLVAYLSKTNLHETIAAMPAAARPDLRGPRRADWEALGLSLLAKTRKGTFDLLAALGLDEHVGENYYDQEGKNPKPVEHGEVLGKAPGPWLKDLLSNLAVEHIETGNALTLDDGQERRTPPLTIKGEQAIPLEDRYHKFKQSSGNLTDLSRTATVIKNEWTKATTRRTASTAARTAFTDALAVANAFIAGYGAVVGKVASLGAIRTDLALINANPDTVATEHDKLRAVELKIGTWQAANTNDSVAYGLVSALILDANWANKGEAFIGKKVPGGVTALRGIVNGAGTAAAKQDGLARTAKEKIDAPDKDRHDTTKALYALLHGMQAQYGAGGAAGWNDFVRDLDAVIAGL